MTRRPLAPLIELIGTAGVVVGGLARFFPVEDRSTFELDRSVVTSSGAGNTRIHAR